MGNKSNALCFDCSKDVDSSNMDLGTSSKKSIFHLVKIQRKINYFLFRLKLSKFFEMNKDKCKNYYQLQDMEFLDISETEKFLVEKKYKNRKFPFEVFNDEKLQNNSEVFYLIRKFYLDFNNEVENFYKIIERKNFKNVNYLPIYKDKYCENYYFSYFNFITSRMIGHIIIFKNDKKIQILLKNSESHEAKGIIFYENGDLYIGNLLLNRLKFLNFEDMDPITDTNSFNNSATNSKRSREDFLHYNSNKIKEKLILSLESVANVEFVEKITDAYPYSEGLFIRKNTCEVLHLKNGIYLTNENLTKKIFEKFSKKENYDNESEYENFPNADKQKTNFEKDENNSMKNDFITIDSAVLYDYNNKTKYVGDVNFNTFTREIMKVGKGKLSYFETENYYFGEWANNSFNGEGEFIDFSEGTITSGVWLNGKLNGKGFIKNKLGTKRQSCTWRFGRLINNFQIVNNKIEFNENIFQFLNDDDCFCLIKIKNKQIHSYLMSDNRKKLNDLKKIKEKFNNKISFEEKKTNDFYIDDLKITDLNNTNINQIDLLNYEMNLVANPVENSTNQYNIEIPYDPEFDEENKEIIKITNQILNEFDNILNKPWKIMEEKSDYKSFYHDEKDGIRSIKSETIIRRSLKECKDYILDISKRINFNKNLDVIKDLRNIQDTYFVKYLKTKSVLFVSARDFVLAEKKVETEDQLILVSCSLTSPNYPAYKGVVRSDTKYSGMICTKLDENTTKIINFSSVDVKIAQVLVNTSLKDAARNIHILKTLIEA